MKKEKEKRCRGKKLTEHSQRLPLSRLLQLALPLMKQGNRCNHQRRRRTIVLSLPPPLPFRLPLLPLLSIKQLVLLSVQAWFLDGLFLDGSEACVERELASSSTARCRGFWRARVALLLGGSEGSVVVSVDRIGGFSVGVDKRGHHAGKRGEDERRMEEKSAGPGN